MPVILAHRLAALAAAALCAGAAQAAELTVTSYDMPNGDGQAHQGTYNYWDASYDGSGSTTTDRSALSGGTGKLTDGVIATDTWIDASNALGTGDYVGWKQSPTITFHFGSTVDVDEIKLYVDNSGVGGVTAPSQVTADGVVIASQGAGIQGVEVLDFTGLDFVGDTLTLTLTASSPWVFMSEVEFFGSPVPEPGRATLLLAGLSLLALAARRRGLR